VESNHAPVRPGLLATDSAYLRLHIPTVAHVAPVVFRIVRRFAVPKEPLVREIRTFQARGLFRGSAAHQVE
jgi:hypothetical protein